MNSKLLRKKIPFPNFWILFLILTGCKSIDPLPPEEKIIDPPIKTASLSYLSIPIELNLKNSFVEAEKDIPKTFSGKQNSCEGLSYTYRLNRDAIQFKTNTNGLDFSTSLKYSLDLSYCPKCTDLFSKEGNCVVPRFFGSCGINEPLRKASISFSSKINILSDYQIKSKTSLSNLDLTDPCKITLVNYDITSILDKEIKKEMKTIENQIDNEINKIDIKSLCTSAWSEIQNPIKIDKYGYLSINPEKISISQLQFANNKAQFNIGIETRPIVRTEYLEEKKITLPNLTEFKKSDGFTLTLDIFASYDSLNNWIYNALKNKPIEINKKVIFFDTVKIIGADGYRLFTQVHFSGARNGKLFFSVKPNFDQNEQKLAISELQMDLKTRNVVLKTAKWLLNEKITQKLEKNIYFDLSNLLTTATKKITKSLNTRINEQVEMNGMLQNIRIMEIYPLKKGIFVRSEISGQLKLIIE